METSFDPDDAGRRSSDGVGAMLRERRIELGLSQADVANVVKLPPRRIEAMESERWHELPDGPYLRGFLKNIARALNLDATVLMDRVDASLVRSRNPESLLGATGAARAPRATLPRRSGPAAERRAGRSLVFGAFAFAILAAMIAWSGTESFDRAVGRGRELAQASRLVGATPEAPAARVEPPAVDADATASPAAPTSPSTDPGVQANAADPALPAKADPAASSAVSLRLRFNQESWVEVRSADGRVLLSRLNPAGTEQTVEGEAPYRLVVGNARGVAVEFRGQAVDLAPYTRDSVARFTLS